MLCILRQYRTQCSLVWFCLSSLSSSRSTYWQFFCSIHLLQYSTVFTIQCDTVQCNAVWVRKFRTTPLTSSWKFVKLTMVDRPQHERRRRRPWYCATRANTTQGVCAGKDLAGSPFCFNAVSSSGQRCLAGLHKKLHLLDNAVLLLTLQHWASFVYTPLPKPMANVLFPVLWLLSGTTGLELWETLNRLLFASLH